MDSSDLVMQPEQEKKYYESKPALLFLKTNIVAHLALGSYNICMCLYDIHHQKLDYHSASYTSGYKEPTLIKQLP